MSSLIKLECLSKTYTVGNNEVHALRNVNFQINEGEMLAIMGTSGSGKSTLMNIIGFLDSPSSGHYYFKERDVSRLTEEVLARIRNLHIGFVFQSFFLLPRLTALQNVKLPLFYRGINEEEAEEKALSVMAKVGISHLAQHKPNQLSGGQQQRVAISRALVGDPDVILADEPTGALDFKTGNEIMSVFLQLHQQEARTIVLITHDDAIANRCQRIVRMRDGLTKDAL